MLEPCQKRPLIDLTLEFLGAQEMCCEELLKYSEDGNTNWHQCQDTQALSTETQWVLIPRCDPFQPLATPSFTFSFISCLEVTTVGGGKNLLSCGIQAPASSLLALFFTGKSLNSPPRAGRFPRATPRTGIQSCGQRAVSSQAGAFGLSPTQASSDCCLFGTEASLARSQPPVASEERLWASELAAALNNFVLLLLI